MEMWIASKQGLGCRWRMELDMYRGFPKPRRVGMPGIFGDWREIMRGSPDGLCGDHVADLSESTSIQSKTALSYRILHSFIPY